LREKPDRSVNSWGGGVEEAFQACGEAVEEIGFSR
jgi:hypothetical protein